jgi:hypothetical protein
MEEFIFDFPPMRRTAWMPMEFFGGWRRMGDSA